MLRILVSIALISILVHTTSSSSYSPATQKSINTYKKFIKDECNSTTYPNFCYNYLSHYAWQVKTNRVTLTKVAVNITVMIAKSSFRTLTKLSQSTRLTKAESSVLADCRDNIDDTVDRLQQSAKQLARLNGTRTVEERFEWDSIKTWMSAAITDEYTCTDGIGEMKVRVSLQKKIQSSIANVAWMNSNALALVNKISY
ncbi:21 kDa protein [Arachis hypogaea]|nr:21 kDa protein [Arachis hypogaea]